MKLLTDPQKPLALICAFSMDDCYVPFLSNSCDVGRVALCVVSSRLLWSTMTLNPNPLCNVFASDYLLCKSSLVWH